MPGIRTNRGRPRCISRSPLAAAAGNSALLGNTLFPAVRMLQGDKDARGLIARAQENSLELTAGDSSIESDIDITKFFPVHGLRKLRVQRCINVTPITWTQQKKARSWSRSKSNKLVNGFKDPLWLVYRLGG